MGDRFQSAQMEKGSTGSASDLVEEFHHIVISFLNYIYFLILHSPYHFPLEDKISLFSPSDAISI